MAVAKSGFANAEKRYTSLSKDRQSIKTSKGKMKKNQLFAKFKEVFCHHFCRPKKPHLIFHKRTFRLTLLYFALDRCARFSDNTIFTNDKNIFRKLMTDARLFTINFNYH